MAQPQNIYITFSENHITITKFNDPWGNPRNLDRNTIKMEMSVARIFHRVLNNDRVIKLFRRDDYELLGSMLYRILMRNPEVKNLLVPEFKDSLRNKEKRCRLGLQFLDMHELASLPWEYLQIPEGNEENLDPAFLGASADAQFDLYRGVKIDEAQRRTIPDADILEKINVICIRVDAPHPKEPLGSIPSLSKTFQELRDETAITDAGGKPVRYQLEIFEISNPGSDQLSAYLEAIVPTLTGPYIIHFIGHAAMKELGPVIGLPDKTGNLNWVPGKDFAGYFDHHDFEQPLLVVLQACESGQINEHGEGLGYAICKKGVPAVVAMQNIVEIEASRLFCQILYRELLAGKDIAEAVTKGRSFLGCEYKRNKKNTADHYSDNAFGTPVLFMNTPLPLRLMPIAAPKEQVKTESAFVCDNPKCGQPYTSNALIKCIKAGCNGNIVRRQNISLNKPPGDAVTTQSRVVDEGTEKVLSTEEGARANSPGI